MADLLFLIIGSINLNIFDVLVIRYISIYLVLSLPVSFAWSADYDEVRQLISKGSYTQALRKLDSFEESISGGPARAKLAFFRARALTLSGDVNEAISIYQALTQQFPANPEPYLNLSALYADQGDLEVARDWALKGLRSEENFKKLYNNLTTFHSVLAANAYRAALNDPSKVSVPSLAISAEIVFDEPSMSESVTSKAQANRHSLNKTEALAKGQALLESVAYEEINEFIFSWVDDWTNQNVEAYIANYTDTYAPIGLTHLEWVEQRRVRLNNKGFIKVVLEHVNITYVKNVWQAEFLQSYESDSIKDINKKRLRLERVLDRWLITDEQVL